MGMLNTFAFIFFAGILGSTIAQKHGETIPPQARFFGYVNTTVAEVEAFDEEMCTQNGGPTAYEDHKKNWRHVARCVHSEHMEVSYELMRESYSSPRDRLEATYEAYCRRVSNLESCIKNITDSVKTCLDPERHENANMIYNTISSVMRFMCEDRAFRLKFLTEFDAQSGNLCIRSNQDALEDCAKQTIIKYVHATIPHGAAMGGLGAIHFLVPDTAKCTEVSTLYRPSIPELHVIGAWGSGEFNIKFSEGCNELFPLPQITGIANSCS